jgi:hypothetical protein
MAAMPARTKTNGVYHKSGKHLLYADKDAKKFKSHHAVESNLDNILLIVEKRPSPYLYIGVTA